MKTLSTTSKKSSGKTPSIVLPEIELSCPSTNGSPEEEIRERAYSLYLAEGRPDGRDMEHWLAAEADCNAVMKNGEAPGSGEAETEELQQAKAAKKPASARPRARKSAAA